MNTAILYSKPPGLLHLHLTSGYPYREPTLLCLPAAVINLKQVLPKTAKVFSALYSVLRLRIRQLSNLVFNSALRQCLLSYLFSLFSTVPVSISHLFLSLLLVPECKSTFFLSFPSKTNHNSGLFLASPAEIYAKSGLLLSYPSGTNTRSDLFLQFLSGLRLKTGIEFKSVNTDTASI
jgi:hypothetical protein